MAIINCPGCSRRISSKTSFCPHCELALGEMSEADAARLKYRRWRRRIFQARNITYAAMTALVIGALWWWLAEPQGFSMPPPAVAVVLVVVGAAGYVAARGWLFWLKMKRNRPERPE